MDGAPVGPPSRSLGGARLAIHQWVRDDVVVEAAVFGLSQPPDVFPHRVVDAAVAFVWRVRVGAGARSIGFRAAWARPPLAWRAWPDSGERLEAITGHFDGTGFALGTQDAGALSYRAAAGDWLPPRWAEPLLAHVEGRSSAVACPTRYEADGVSVVFEPATSPVDEGDERRVPVPKEPFLRVGDRLQVHFVMAWKATDADDVAPWLCVDCNAADLVLAISDLAVEG